MLTSQRHILHTGCPKCTARRLTFLLLAMLLRHILLASPFRYLPAAAALFSIVPLSWPEWQLVLLWSAPVIVLDEVLKALARMYFGVRKLKAD
jgi:hypothetical protein